MVAVFELGKVLLLTRRTGEASGPTIEKNSGEEESMVSGTPPARVRGTSRVVGANRSSSSIGATDSRDGPVMREL